MQQGGSHRSISDQLSTGADLRSYWSQLDAQDGTPESHGCQIFLWFKLNIFLSAYPKCFLCYHCFSGVCVSQSCVTTALAAITRVVQYYDSRTLCVPLSYRGYWGVAQPGDGLRSPATAPRRSSEVASEDTQQPPTPTNKSRYNANKILFKCSLTPLKSSARVQKYEAISSIIDWNTMM